MPKQIIVPGEERWDEENEIFIYTKDYVLTLEHSLVSLSKWESKWRKPFVSNELKTEEETIDYIRFMTLTQNVPDKVYHKLTAQNYAEINEYIEEPMTASWVNERNTHRRSSEQMTSELIYYWMSMLGIPMECQKWHLNKLLMQIRVNNAKSQPKKKRSKRDILSSNAALNAARRKQLHTKG